VGTSLLFGLFASDILENIETQGDMQHLADIIYKPEAEMIADYVNWLRDNPSSSSSSSSASSVSIEAQKIDLGRALFVDATLSLRGTMSCSTCHSPLKAFTDARKNRVDGALAVGDDNVTLGGRNVPTAAYAQFVPDFAQLPDGNYSGGMFHDGRALNLKAQAKGPLLDPAEMMMPDAASVVDRVLQNSDHVIRMRAIYGDDAFDDTDTAYDHIAEAIARFEKTETFAKFNSKYDRSKLDAGAEDYYEMSALEQAGYTLFFDANRTGCTKCHTLNSGSESTREIFTNFRYANIGRPKNLSALLERDGNTDTTDLGLGGRADINDSAQYGKTRIPTLRNIAVTGPYMNNGVFKELRTVIEFYDFMAGNDPESLNPETNASWGAPEVNATISHKALELLKPLSEEDVDALVAFLKTLTDKEYEGLVAP